MTQFTQALARPEVVAELTNGWLQLADLTANATASTAAMVSHRQGLRSLLEAIHALFEGPARRFGLLFLELVGKGIFEADLTSDGAERLAVVTQDRTLKHLFYGLNKELRIAHAHQTYRIEAGHVVTLERTGQQRTYSAGVLFDQFLAGIESVTAVGCALLVAAHEAGIDLVGEDYARALGITDDQLLTMMMSFAGAEDAHLDADHEPPRIDLSCAGLTLGHISVAEYFLPSADQVHMTVRLKDSGQIEEWNIRLAALRDYREMDEGPAKDWAFIEALSVMTRNGAPALQDAVVRHLIAGHALTATTLGYPEGPQALRRLRLTAREHQWVELEDALKRVMRYVRLSITDGEATSLADLTCLQPFFLSEIPKLPFSISV